MNKELYISATPHETRIALSEDGDLTEVYYEREREYSLAGSIYKGRVTRVLPGMQSAFVDIGLERDAFLYVSDFFEDVEEYDRVVSEAEAAAAEAHPAETAASPAAAFAPPAPAAAEAMPADAPPGARSEGLRHRRRRGRHGRRGIPESKFASPDAVAAPGAAPAAEPPETAGEKQEYPFVLPGESLAKYQGAHREDEGAHREDDAAPPEAVQRAEFEHERMQPDSPAEFAAAPAGAAEAETAPAAAEDTRGGESQPGEEEAGLAAGAAETWFEDEEESEPEDAASSPESGNLQEPQFEAGNAAAGAIETAEAEESAGAADRAEVRERPQRAEFQARAETGGRRRRRGRGRGRGRGPHAEGAAAPTSAGHRGEERERGPRLINELLRPGQEILVQIAKEPLGTKGARITSHLALPGRFLVYMPTVQHIGVSRKIGSDEERARLKRIIVENSRDLPGGFIVRTASQGISEEDLKADIRFLGNLWADIRGEFEQRKAPALLHHDLGLLERTLRDQLSEEFTHIWVDSEDQYQAVVRFIDHFMPKLTSRVRLYTRDEPMFEHFGIQDEINKALKSKVWLKSGGYIVINQTEALVAIDVNTGKYVGKSNRLEDTIVKINVDAIREIVRQIRLRDLGGIIVVDFIDMDERKNRQKVMQALEEALRADRAPSKVLSFNDFGLVALTRKRVKQSLERTLGTPCPYCSGVGLVKSVTTMCNEIYAEARKMAKEVEREDLILRVNPEVAKALKAHGARLLTEMETMTGKAIAVKADPLVHQEQFEFF
ncbi:MAG TPA: Rne/Rng family ribonuclease [Terriglobales bacterium]|nr:Rne/Rng family ribonuclease [Terriglobales bacterium]